MSKRAIEDNLSLKLLEMEFVAVECTLQMVPFEETSLVMIDMQTVSVTIIILGK